MNTRRDEDLADAGFLGRWSERKLKSRPEPDADAGAAAPDLSPEPQLEPGAELKSEAEILEELGLPDPDLLGKGDDFSGFLQAAVPAALRGRALRRLWLTDPVLANLDGLVEYGQDFTDAATVFPDIKTAYKVGRGLLRDEPQKPVADASQPIEDAETSGRQPERLSAQAEEPAAEEPVAEGGSADDGAADDPATGPVADATENAGDRGADRPARDTVARIQRMRFQFDG